MNYSINTWTAICTRMRFIILWSLHEFDALRLQLKKLAVVEFSFLHRIVML